MEHYLDFQSVVLRLLLAVFLGGLIGFERTRKRYPAGFRTYLLVCLGSALAMMFGQYNYYLLESSWLDATQTAGARTDITRLGAQVISGIGFLGAGTILVTERQEIKGATTAAGLWTSACMGLAIGVGFYECALIAFVLIILTMRVLYLIEQNLVENSRDMILYIDFASLDDLNGIISHIKSQGSHIYEVDINRGHNEISRHPSAVFTIRLDKKVSHIQILKAISELGSVLFVDEL